MPEPYSYDLREKAIKAVKRGEKKIAVCRLLKISRNTLDLWLKREAATGDFRAITRLASGPTSKIKDWQKFLAFILEHSNKTQKQLAELWGNNLRQQNVSDACKKLGITRKKKTYGYRERNEEERSAFRSKLGEIEKKRIVYVDEAGFDNRDDYPYGYSPKGERCYALKSGKKKERVSWIAALKSGRIFAPLTFKGSCNRDLFEFWLKESLMPQVEAGDIIVIDNASFHKGESIREIVESAYG